MKGRQESNMTVSDILDAIIRAANPPEDSIVFNYPTLGENAFTSLFISPKQTSLSFKDLNAPGGMQQVAAKLTSDECAQITSLDLSHNKTDDECTEILMDALIKSGKKQFKWLDLSSKNLGDRGAIAIAKAIEAGCFPNDFVLRLHDTNIGDKGAIALANALAHPNCPEHMDLFFVINKVTATGAKVMRDHLSNMRYKQHVEIKFYTALDFKKDKTVADEEVVAIENLAENYEQRYLARFANNANTFYKANARPTAASAPEVAHQHSPKL